MLNSITPAGKLCIQCKHYTETMPQCHAPGNYAGPDLVKGKSFVPQYYQAIYLRQYSELCGPDAKWYEEKEDRPLSIG